MALVFLVVTIVAVLVWEKTEPEDPAGAGARPVPSEPGTRLAGRSLPPTDEALVPLAVRPTPLRRDIEALRSRELEEAAERARAAAEAERTELPDRPPAEVASGRAPAEEPAPRAGGSRSSGDAAASEAAPRPLEPRVYVVRSGDTLSEISLRELGTSKRWQEIVELNPGLDPVRLKEGARLRMPAGGAAAAPAPATASREAPPRAAEIAKSGAGAASFGRSYRVQEGDSLWKIAAAQLGDGNRWKEIVALNPAMNPDRLSVGQVLSIPGARDAGSAVVAAAETAPPRRGRTEAGAPSSTPTTSSTSSTSSKRGKVR